MKKLSVCLFVVIFVVIKIDANEIPIEIRNIALLVRDKCHRETGIDIEHVDRTVEGYFHPSEVLGCYFSCVFTAFNLVDHDGHIDFDKVLPKLPESFRDHGEEMVAKCRHITGTNPCDGAFNIVQCFQKTNPQKYFVI